GGIAGNDVFVTKLNPDGSAPLVYSTFLGGSHDEEARGIAVDGTGSAFVTGETLSTDFPTTPGAFDTTHNSAGDVFVTRLDAAGSALAYSTFVGVSCCAYGIAVDGTGSTYVTGATDGADFPTTPGAFDTTFNGGADAFVTKLNAAGSALVYSTFLGSPLTCSPRACHGVDYGTGIAVDGTGSAYVIGYTDGADFPTTPGALDTTFNGGISDVFVTKLNAAGSALVYSTFLGGSGEEQSTGIAVDGTGFTRSTAFPTTLGAFDTGANGSYDVFVLKIVVNRASAPPLPAFTYSPSNPVTGSPVSFDASSSTCPASPCSYGWTDDADSSLLGTGVRMSFTFRNPGTKYVRLTITDAQSRSASVEHDVMVSP